MTKPVNNVIDNVQFRAEFLKKKYLKKKKNLRQPKIRGSIWIFLCCDLMWNSENCVSSTLASGVSAKEYHSVSLCIQIIVSTHTVYFFSPHRCALSVTLTWEQAPFFQSWQLMSLAESLEDRCSRAPEATFSSDVVRCWQLVPLTTTSHPLLFREVLQTQWVIGYKCDVLAASIESDLNPFRKAGVIVPWEGSAVLSIKKIQDPGELTGWLFIWDRPHVNVAMIREVPHPYTGLPRVPPHNKWFSEVDAF